MSKNHWETQPRKKNGEFTFRLGQGVFRRILDEVARKLVEEASMLKDKGGSYGYLRKFVAGDKNYEIHHMPAASCSSLSRWRGPCIIMTKENHKQTSSYGNSKSAKRYRLMQAKLISEGKFLESEYMDIKNIRRKFGRKYDSAINKKLDYEEELEKKGRIYG
ncbi:MAG: hypothetical protein SPI86_03715 [Treponemataceae bacterium]|nr:hypothetical protein [Spirochaetales bacterium]MDY6030854.1 hypothetical protein [Treponemataceae bacterium]